MTDPLYIGRPVYEPKPHTRLDPLALVEDGAWRVYKDWTKALPKEGRVFAPRLTGFTVRSLVAFKIAPNLTGEKDECLVSDPKPVIEVLDFRHADAEAARRRLVEDGLSQILSGCTSVVAALPDGLCVVVPLVRHPSTEAWVADIVGLDHLQTHLLDQRLFSGDKIDGHWIAVPDVTVGALAGQVNWCRDADFLESLLKRLRKSTQQGAGSLSRAQITHLVGQLVRGELLPSDGADLESYRDRLEAFGAGLVTNLESVDKIVAVLGDQQSVQEGLEAFIAERKTVLEAELRSTLEASYLQDLEASFSSYNEQRDQLATEVAALQSSLEIQRSQLDEERTQVKEARAALSTDLLELLAELDEEPLLEDADVARLGKRLAVRLGDPGHTFTTAAAAASPWAAPEHPDATLRPWAELDQVVVKTAQRWGYLADDLRIIDVCARGGMPVLLPEQVAGDLVACYAELIAGGGMSRHVLDPSVISVEDLWRPPGSARLGAFAKAWARARLDPARYQVVLLDGLHRTPSALWMPTFIDVMREARRPPNLLIFVSTGETPVDPERAWDLADDGMVAFSPTTSAGLPAAFLSRMAGKERSAAVFNAAEGPQPTVADLLKATEKLETALDGRRLRTACGLVRAAWSYGEQVALQSALALCGTGESASPAFTAGQLWVSAAPPQQDDR
ncbi:hypothetical protein [Brevundimonas sp.]|uniref:hypothetical protein n=1 Tax=Brevundimonas sp. TaxID=1871086 RepID=UPI0025BBB498|nr:hypothetical protein [Brevundimonas sp.]